MDSKIIISAKRLGKRIIIIVTDIFAMVGVLVMIAEAALEIFGYNGLFEFYKKKIWWIIGIIILISICKNWDWLKKSVKIANYPDVTITLKVCDILKNKGAIIIPTNTTFDTLMEDEFISEGSVQGQYQVRYFKNKKEELDRKLEDGLKGKSFTQLNDGRKSKTKRYPIGTVSRINEKDKRAYFLADSDVNEKGIPINVDTKNITDTLVGLWNSLAEEGNNETYSIPLIGTGKARVKDASRDEIVRDIILTFLAATKDHKITENLIICIHTEDFEKINWDNLCEFLNYQSQYANIKPTDLKPIGTAENTPELITYKGEYYDKTEKYNESSNKGNPQKGITEKEQLLIRILTENKMTRSEIAEAMNLSISATNQMLRKLHESQIVDVEGMHAEQKYYVTKEVANYVLLQTQR